MADISHESLIRRWATLKDWVREEVYSVRWYADAARDTLRRRSGKSQTWRDPKLANARAYLDDGDWNDAWARWNFEDEKAEEQPTFGEVKDFLDLGTLDQMREKEREEKLVRAEADAARRAEQSALAAAKAEGEAKEKALALAESERVAKDAARREEEAERLAKEYALARAEAEGREKEQALARAAAERGQRQWFQRGLILALLFVAAAGVGAWYYYRANSMQQNLTVALEDQTKAQDSINRLTGTIEYYDGKIREAQVALDRKPAVAERQRIEKELAQLRAQRGADEAKRFAAERDRLAAQKRVNEIAQFTGQPGSATQPSDDPRKQKVMPDGLTYVRIPAGSFQMGCSPGDRECYDDEKPVHEVTITNAFWIGQTEVTQAAWKRVMKTNPARFEGDDLPVESVSWDDANRYCQAIGARLPTEAEWEYAARAGSKDARYGALVEVAWFRENSGGKTHPAGTKKPNAFDLYDMLGNLREWVADWDGPYSAERVKDPRGPTSGTSRVLRGGSWYNSPVNARVSYRYRGEPTNRNDYTGFRCAGD